MTTQQMKFEIGDIVRVPGGRKAVVSRRERCLAGERPVPGKTYPERYRVEFVDGFDPRTAHFMTGDLEATR